MKGLAKFCTGVKEVFDYNGATLSGAADVIVIRHEDGSLHATPFFVRFGKWKVFKSKRKKVLIKVNNQSVDIHMHLEANGKAVFSDAPEELRVIERSSSLPVSSRLENADSEQIHDTKNERNFSRLNVSERRQQPFRGYMEEVSEEKKTIFRKKSGQQIELSLCKDKIKPGDNSEEIFNRYRVPWEEFIENPWKIVSEQELMVRLNGEIVDWNVAAPAVFEQLSIITPPQDRSQTINPAAVQEEPLFLNLPLHSGRGVSPYDGPSSLPTKTSSQSSSVKPQVSFPSEYDLASTSNRLFFSDLVKLNLIPNVNSVTYTVTSRLRGEQTVSAWIYLWDYTTKIVVSDVDGTITRSNVLGHVLPKVGKDWSRSGVCKLYSDIENFGYHLVYLTARAIGQTEATRQYLLGLDQGHKRLPSGPVLTTPYRLFASFMKEITHQAKEFKASVLCGILHLFPPNVEPLYAGFGNTGTDALAYQIAGIPDCRNFTIDEAGELTSFDKVKTNYFQLAENLAEVFDHSEKVNEAEIDV